MQHEDMDFKLESPPVLSRAKSSQRMNYDAHVGAIKRQIGNLEEIRNRLALSQRKICQLLMVDPSAWTRWTRSESEAPPHIYRALQWYLALNEKIPGLTPQYFIGKDPEVLHQVALKKIQSAEAENQDLQRQLVNLKIQLEIQSQRLDKTKKYSQFGFILLTGALLAWGVLFYFAAV